MQPDAPSPLAKSGDSRLVYFMQSPVNQRDLDRFNIRAYAEAGYLVTVVDLSELMFPHLTFDRTHYSALGDVDIRVIRNNAQLEMLAPLLDQARLVFFLAQSFGVWRRNLAALRLVSRSKIPYLIMSINTTSEGKIQPSSGKFRRIAERIRTARLPDAIIRHLPVSVLGVRTADFVVCDGADSLRPNRLIGAGTRVIWAHSGDYEAYRNSRDAFGPATPTAVFLDQYIPWHRDLAEAGCKPIDAATYHQAMNRVFDRIEKDLNLKVLIAVHPRAAYRANPYDGRPLISGETMRLVAESRLVITHCSTAVSFAVLFNKPILVMATKPFHQCHPVYQTMIDGLARALGQALLFAEDIRLWDMRAITGQAQGAYSRYVTQRLKVPDSPDRPFWDIVGEAVGLLPRT